MKLQNNDTICVRSGHRPAWYTTFSLFMATKETIKDLGNLICILHTISYCVTAWAWELWLFPDFPPELNSTPGDGKSIAAGLPMSYKSGPRWDDVITWSDLNLRPVLDSSAQTTRGNVLDFL